MSLRIPYHTFPARSFPFTSFIRTTGRPPCVIIVATAVVASEAPVVASFSEKSLCKSLLCRRSQLAKLQVLLLQSLTDGQVSGN